MNGAEGFQTDPYQQIPELYDMEHDDFTEDVDCLLALCGQIDDPLLEIGCGTGRVLAPLASAGHQIVGIDSSQPMLDRARVRINAASADKTATLVHHRIEALGTVPGGPFGGVLCTLNSLMHVADQDAQVEAIAAIAKLLKPGGTLVIDLLNPAPEYLVSVSAAPIHEWTGHLPDGSTVDKTAWREIDAVNQTINTTLWYDQVVPDGQLRRSRVSFDLRYIHAGELTLMLDAAGFESHHFFGSYELAPFTSASDRMLVLATLPE